MLSSESQQYAFFHGQVVPLEEAKVGVMTHALNYGTGVFEGIRGYWNADKEEIYIFRLKDHYTRFLRNTSIMYIELPYTVDELVTMTVDLVAKNGYRQDVYIRPLAFKSSERIGVSLEGVEDDLTIIAVPFGNYVDIDRGLSICVSSWRRSSDNAIPGRAKISGNYANTALAKNEALLNGYDEAVVLSEEGFVVEGSAENVFLVRDRTLITPSVADGILEGITRETIATIAEEEMHIPTVQRRVARTELYYSDEIFLVGTGAQVAPVTSVDRRQVGDGSVGAISEELQRLYFEVVKGRHPKYMDWLTPVYATSEAKRLKATAS